ncbi:MAG: hypothetical protein JWM16_6346 [Verrucomicrobiales bacterium]|nr:hypothetical protein [Verrucomicrobiales bacterium]
MKKPTPKTAAPVAKVQAEPKLALPGIGDIAIVHFDTGDYPMIVTRSGEEDCDGQAFLDGTQTRSVLNATYGDGLGQIASPNTHSKEA